MNCIKQGDCIPLLAELPDESIDMVLTDLPYGRTRNKWDVKIPLDLLWNSFDRVVKKNGAIVIFSQMPFTVELIKSNTESFKYEWIWEKENGTGFLNSHFAPLKIHENILVFSKSAASYVKDKSKAMSYFPQMGTGKPYRAVQGRLSESYDVDWAKYTVTESNGERYPTDILKFNRDRDKIHPTQKPVELCKYLINTYTQAGWTVLDPCFGSGSTGVAARELNRDFVGFELDEKYFWIGKERIENAVGRRNAETGSCN